MIFDHRTHTSNWIGLATFLKTYERLALPLPSKHLGEPYAFFVTSRFSGGWAASYVSGSTRALANRELRRDAMEADPAWQAGINHGHALLAARLLIEVSLEGQTQPIANPSYPRAALRGVEL